jgi:CRISPR-associated endonuclease/helicase Cas3
MDYENLIEPKELKDERYWAHTAEGRENETLLLHSQRVFSYYLLYCDKKGIKSLVLNLLNACGCNEHETKLGYCFFIHAIYLHDLGKINPRFQFEKLHNNSFRVQSRLANDSNHSLSSAGIYVDFMRRELGEHQTPKLEKMLCSFAFCISRHHGRLTNGHDFSQLENFNESYYEGINDKEFLEDVQCKIQSKCGITDPLAFYILNRLLYSLIVACDFCATQEYMTGDKPDIAVIECGGDTLRNNYRDGDIYKGIMRYQKDTLFFEKVPINALRSEIFIEAEMALRKSTDANIFYLEAPTGSGKTNMAINLTLTALELDKRLSNVFYIFPFNTLIRQTERILSGYFGENVKTVNSITPILDLTEKINEDIRFDIVWLDHLFNNYPIVATSHINFFNALFGSGREQGFPLLKLCNSVIVLDEIQSYKNDIWREMISFFEKYSKLLNIKIIIMSATLPQLDKLLNINDSKFVSLIKNPNQYYQNPIFKNRVKLDFSLLDEDKISLERLKEKVLEFRNKKVLIEFISKKSAREFYLLLKETDECHIELLTGDDNVARRDMVISKTKDIKPFILVATQVIEAGVDIDMEIGFKDCSLLDSEEQFLGRINRSCQNPQGGIAFFFNYDYAAKIYRGDARFGFTIEKPEIREKLLEKKFSDVYVNVMQELINKTSKANLKNIDNLYINCRELNFLKIEDTMRLMEERFQLFIPYILKSCDGNGQEISGYEVWESFKKIIENKTLSYAKRKIELSMLSVKMSYFTFSEFNKINGLDEYLGYTYIPHGERFIDSEGILDRQALKRAYNGRFL